MKKSIPLPMLILLLSVCIPVLANAAPPSFPTPSQIVTTGKGYWETPMNIQDTQAVWEMLMSPITVVKGHQKSQQVLYSQPDSTSEPVGDVTRDSQGLHVLETRADGWSLVETYSSSFHDSKIRAWNQLV